MSPETNAAALGGGQRGFLPRVGKNSDPGVVVHRQFVFGAVDSDGEKPGLQTEPRPGAAAACCSGRLVGFLRFGDGGAGGAAAGAENK